MQRTITKGKRQIIELQNSINYLEENVTTLNTEIDSQRQNTEVLKTALDNTKSLLDSSMVEYRKELNRQAEVIKKQQSVVGDLCKNKLKQDFVIDSRFFFPLLLLHIAVLIYLQVYSFFAFGL